MDIPQKPAFLASLVFAATLSGCQTSSPPPKPETSAPTPSPAAEKSIGSVRVKAATLNVRQGPSAGDSVLATARRGQKLELLGSDQAWSRVRLADGSVGWVSSKHVSRITAGAPGCLPARNFSFIQAPQMSFYDGGPKGIVMVEASVDASGKVTSTKVTANSTGDASLAQKAATEIATARFSPPVTDCKPRAFIYIYRRGF